MNLRSVPSDDETELDQTDLAQKLENSERRLKELQNSHQALQERFNYMQKATQDALWDWDLQQNIGWYSDGLTALFGYDPSQVGDGVTFWHNAIHPDDMKRVLDGIHAVIDNGGKHWSDRYRFKRLNGEYAWVFDRGYAIHDSNGKPVRMVGSMQDITLEINARDALRESEEKFKATFDQAAVGISIATPEGKFLAVNKAYPEIFGFSETELLEKKISDLSHPDEIEGDREIMAELLGGKIQFAAREKKYIHKSGKIIWGRIFGTVIYDAYRAPKYIVGVLEDITEQRTALNALRESEERLRLVIDSGRIGTWDFDPRSGRLFWDNRCKEMFGMQPEDNADYEIFLQRVHPDDRNAADEANRRAINGHDDGEYDLEYRTIGLRDHKLRWLRAKGRSYKDANGETYRYAGTVLDITEAKERENAVRVQEQRFRLLATSIPQIVWTTDEDGIIDYMSDKWELYTGHKPTYEKFSFRSLMHPDDLNNVVPDWNDRMKQGDSFHGEYRLQNTRNNEYRWYSCTVVPLKDEKGKVLKWIGSATDIHDQKMIELQLEQKVLERTKELTDLNHRLEKSNSELEQYAYVTSHDLKEPLRKIQMYNNLITTRYQETLPTEVQRYFSKILNSTQRMSGLIDDLLKFSRLSDSVAAFEDVDLNIVLHNIRADFDFELKEKQIDVQLKPLPFVRGVSVQIHQLFLNLFSNSIKFSKLGGSNRIVISATALSEEEKHTYPALKDNIRYHKIIFVDEGIGFSPDYNEQIFTMFQRLHNRTEYDGHGIGLALCRKITNNHHGHIRAFGQEGHGATFEIILPFQMSNL